MSSKKVLVTGGAGYIGVQLVKQLLDSGYEVKLFDCFYFGLKPIKLLSSHKNLSVIEGDIRDTKSIETLLEYGTSVVHLASLSNDPSCDLDPKWSTEINHNATVRLAELAKKKKCGRFVFASSCSVYGHGGKELLKETSACEPVSLYAELKLKSEKEVFSLADDTFCPTSIRQATIFGYSSRMRFDLAINMMTMHAITKGKIYVMGGGEQWRPFLHVRDAANIFKMTIEAELEKVFGQLFNAGSNENNFQIKNLAERVQKEIGNTVVEVTPDDADRRDYNVDFSKIKNVLGFVPQVSVSDAIAEIAEFVKKDIGKDYFVPEFFNIKKLKELEGNGFKPK